MPNRATTKQPSQPDIDKWDGFVTEVEAADYLCQSVRTLQKWRVTGFGPAYYKIGRSVRYKRGEVQAWVNARRRAHTSQTI